MQGDSNDDGLPRREKECRHGQDVKDGHDDRREPIDLASIPEVDIAARQDVSLVDRNTNESLSMKIGRKGVLTVIVV